MDSTICRSAVTALSLLAWGAWDIASAQIVTPESSVSSQETRSTLRGLLALPTVDASRLENTRGAADTYEAANFMNLRGSVSNTRASELITGNNSISDGAFSGAVGLPMVIQNSGNNVLIQNATIINLRVF